MTEHHRLDTTTPNCKWCIWKGVGHNYCNKTVFYPIDYCKFHARQAQNNTFYVIEGYDDRVFLSRDEAIEWDCDNNLEYYGCKEWSMSREEDCIFEEDYTELNQEQKDILMYKLLINT